MRVTRFFVLLPVIGLLLGPTACGGRGGSFAPAVSSSARHGAAPARGTILSMSLWGTLGKTQMGVGPVNHYVTYIGGAPICSVKLYAIKYATVGVNGEPATASAAFMVPGKGCKGPFTLIGYAHGTNPVKDQLITDPYTASPAWTAPDQNPVTVAAIYAAHGYAVAATDYLGLGFSNYPYHPYLVADAEASAVIDSMRAARLAAAQLHVELSGKVYLAGHSQGGQSAMATQRTIEAQNAAEFDLIADAPSSGPYALTQTFQDSLRNQSEDAPILAAYILTAYHKTYNNVYTDPTTVFQNPYASGINSLMPVRTYKDEAALEGKTLPLKLGKLLQPAWMTSFLNDPTSDARVDTAKNDLLQGWKPVAPVYLCGGKLDPEVEFKNAQLALKYFRSEGAKVQLLDVNKYIPSYVPPDLYHVTVALFCLTIERAQVLDAAKTLRKAP